MTTHTHKITYTRYGDAMIALMSFVETLASIGESAGMLASVGYRQSSAEMTEARNKSRSLCGMILGTLDYLCDNHGTGCEMTDGCELDSEEKRNEYREVWEAKIINLLRSIEEDDRKADAERSAGIPPTDNGGIMALLSSLGLDVRNMSAQENPPARSGDEPEHWGMYL